MKPNTIQQAEMQRAALHTPDKARRRIPGAAATKLLTYAVVLLQITGFSLVALKTQPADMRALLLAAALPLSTLALTMGLDKKWHIDRPLLLLVMFLTTTGMLVLQDITKPPTSLKHAIFVAAGLVCMLIAVRVMRRLTRWEAWARAAMPVGLVLMLMPMMPYIGGTINGARNWVTLKKFHIDLGLQPSEFVKILLLLILSSAFAENRGFKRMLPALAFAVIMCGILLVIQRDLGTLLIYFFLTLSMYYISTGNITLTLMGLGGGAAGAVGAYYMLDHVRTRVEIWQNPWRDSQNTGYQLVQALIAISSGGLEGLGIGLGTPRIVPYYHTDFIFAAICEELGLIYAVCVILAYIFIVLRGMRIAREATTAFHALMAFGATLMLGLQAFIIIGGVIKLIPLTGVTLPFISAGGSSMISCMALVGILLGISSINDQERRRQH